MVQRISKILAVKARNHGVKNPLNFIIITDGELLELGPSQDDTDFVPAATGMDTDNGDVSIMGDTVQLLLS
jgi:hypothetical protein